MIETLVYIKTSREHLCRNVEIFDMCEGFKTRAQIEKRTKRTKKGTCWQKRNAQQEPTSILK